METYRHLSCEDRDQIAVLLVAGHNNTSIARILGRSPSTISRELKRNSLQNGRYSAQIADGAYMHRRQRNAVIERDERLALFVRDRLAEGWSPQQISGWLRSGVEAGLRTVAMETIYAFIYPPLNPCSSRSRSKTRLAVCRCLRFRLRSSCNHWSMKPVKPSSLGRLICAVR